MKPTAVILIHGTNGEGYSSPTIKRLKSLPEALKYISKVFDGRHPVIENGIERQSSFSIYETTDEDTERISVFEVFKEDFIVVDIVALTTEFNIHYCRTKKLAQAKLKELSSVIIEPNEDDTDDLKSGEGDDGYYHFEIV